MTPDFFQSLIRELLLLQRAVQHQLGETFLAAAKASDLRQTSILMLLALVFGLVHAIGPGHGKSILLAYFLGRQARLRDGLTASVKLIAMHVGSAILLVLGAVTLLDMSFGLRPADFPLVRGISYAGIIAVGALLLIRALRSAPDLSERALQHSGDGLLPYIVGLSPCPLTTIMMLAAVGTGALALGLAVSFAMALGMIATVGGFALAGVLCRDWLLRVLTRHRARVARIARALEILGALLVTLLGLLLLGLELA